jgi:hypothetical protein
MPGSDATKFPWHKLRHQDRVHVRAIAESRHRYQTANNYLYVLRGIRRECWKLGLTSTDAYHRAVSVAPVKGASLPAGRWVTPRNGCGSSVPSRPSLRRSAFVTWQCSFAVLRATGIRKARLPGRRG